MNKTKRKIFETSMRLFAEKGYDATSIEDITETVGVAKGTLYYHFKRKEEIFEFLVDEGVKLIINSIEIKTSKVESYIDKLKAVSLVQLKAVNKYEDLLTVVMSHTWGNETKNVFCRDKVSEYIDVVQKYIDEGIEKGEIIDCDSRLLASEIFSLTCSTLIYKRTVGDENFDIQKIYHEYEKTLFKKLENSRGM